MTDIGQDTMDDVIGAKEASDLLGLSQRQFLRLIKKSPEIKKKQLGREWAISRQSVLEYKVKKASNK